MEIVSYLSNKPLEYIYLSSTKCGLFYCCAQWTSKKYTAVVFVLLLALEEFTNWVGELTVGRGQITEPFGLTVGRRQITEFFISAQQYINARDILLTCSGTELFCHVLLAEFEWFIILRFQPAGVLRIIRFFLRLFTIQGLITAFIFCVNFQIEQDT